VYAFLAEWLFVVAMLPALGAVGGFVVVPFRRSLPFVSLAAPFAGLLVMAFGAALSYIDLGLPIAAGFAITAACGVLATALAVVRAARGGPLRPCWRSMLFPAAVSIVLAGIVVWYTTWTTIMLGHPGLQYWFGTDHLGYAQVADWVIEHPPWDRPRADPAIWYESWPDLMINGDPRFGAFATLALVALVRGLSASFAYDPACAVALTVTILGVAALFARSRLSLVLLVAGLLSSHWFDYGRSGFFAKLLGYPAGIFVGGLFMLAPAPLRPLTLVSLVLMTCGASVVYQAEAPGLIIGLVAASYLAARLILGGPRSLLRPLQIVGALWQHALMLGLMVLLAVVMRTYVAQAPVVGVGALVFITSTAASLVDADVGPRFSVTPWEHVRVTLADLDHQGYPITDLEPETLGAMLTVSIVLWLALGIVAWWLRDPKAIALVWGPILLEAFYASLTSPGAQWTRYQLPGTFYPLALCAAARLLDDARKRGAGRLVGSCRTGPGGIKPGRLRSVLAEHGLAVGVALVMIVGIALHAPRVEHVIDRYASSSMPAHYHFSQVESDRLAAIIGDRTVRVDIDHPHLSIFVLVELGRRGIDIEWAPSSWKYVLGYRPWPPPEPDEPAELTLQSLDDPPGRRITTLLRTRQYRLTAPEERRSTP
jgi:hypothetical protein